MNKELDNADSLPIVWLSAQSWPRRQPSSLEIGTKNVYRFSPLHPLTYFVQPSKDHMCSYKSYISLNCKIFGAYSISK